MQQLNEARLPETFKEYRPYPSAAERAAWQALPQQVQSTLLGRAEAFAGFCYPQITALDWLAFTRSGNRIEFEEKYFARRNALCTLVLGECVQYNGRFLDDIINGLWCICEETAWQLPPHNTYVRDTPVLPMPDITRPLLDLFSCETGALLAMVQYLLQDKLAYHAPQLLANIQHLLMQRVVTPYLNEWFWWMGGNGEKTLNWTVWCTQNALLTVFLLPTDTARQHKAAQKALTSMQHFLNDYSEDGCCDEGAQYYRHAGLCLYQGLQTLDDISGGALAWAFQQPKIQNIARYIMNVHVEDEYYINFADCSPIAGRAGVREFLFGKRCGDKSLMDFAVTEWHSLADKDLPLEINLFYRVQAAFMFAQMQAYTPPSALQHSEIYYPGVGVFVARDDTYVLAVKAGNNDDSHNHNDTGSFTLYKNGKPFCIDLGVESYTAKTFSPQRYEIWTMQSSWHNLPDFDGVMQQAGAQFHADGVQTAFLAGSSQISLHLENAWPVTAKLTSYTRHAVLQKGRGVVVTDICTGTFKQAVMNLQFCACLQIQGNIITLPGIGTVLAQTPKSPIIIEEIEITDTRLRQAWPAKVYRVRIPFEKQLVLHIS